MGRCLPSGDARRTMNEPPLNPPAKQPPPATDSLWFWLALFGVTGLAALFAVSPKYGQRQAGIERKYQAQQQMARSADGMPIAGESLPPNDVAYSDPDNTIVTLWPIRLVVLLITLVSVAQLVRQRRAQHRDCASLARGEP